MGGLLFGGCDGGMQGSLGGFREWLGAARCGWKCGPRGDDASCHQIRSRGRHSGLPPGICALRVIREMRLDASRVVRMR